MKVLLTIMTTVLLTSCGKVERPEEFFDITGDKGKQGEIGLAGEDGKEGEDALFQVSGQLGLYKEELDDNRSFNLTCMQGESSEFGNVVMRIITGSGGMISIRRAGGPSETIYMPANKAIYLYGKSSSGTYIVSDGQSSKTKACSVPR